MLALNAFETAYCRRRVLVTGHTGFKGSWLCLWLHALGSDITGLTLDPSSEPSHSGLLKLSIKDHRIDIRREAAVRRVFAAERPEIVFRLAAQPLVRRSYREPVTTWATNVMGTVHVLEAARHTPDMRANGLGPIVNQTGWGATTPTVRLRPVPSWWPRATELRFGNTRRPRCPQPPGAAT